MKVEKSVEVGGSVGKKSKVVLSTPGFTLKQIHSIQLVYGKILNAMEGKNLSR